MEVCNYSCMPMMGLPCQQYGMTLPQQNDIVSPEQLENLYPETYHIIQPVVEVTCNSMQVKFGPMYTPTREQMETMIDDVYGKVEGDVYKAARDSSSKDERQFYGGGRRILRDLIGILLLQRLIGRRPFYGYPGFYNYPSFYGYPGPYGPGYGIY